MECIARLFLTSTAFTWFDPKGGKQGGDHRIILQLYTTVW
jgi:hypothetical protein